MIEINSEIGTVKEKFFPATRRFINQSILGQEFQERLRSLELPIHWQKFLLEFMLIRYNQISNGLSQRTFTEITGGDGVYENYYFDRPEQIPLLPDIFQTYIAFLLLKQYASNRSEFPSPKSDLRMISKALKIAFDVDLQKGAIHYALLMLDLQDVFGEASHIRLEDLITLINNRG